MCIIQIPVSIGGTNSAAIALLEAIECRFVELKNELDDCSYEEFESARNHLDHLLFFHSQLTRGALAALESSKEEVASLTEELCYLKSNLLSHE